MADERQQPTDDVLHNPESWLTGDEPWTTAQRSYLQTLAREAGAEVPEEMSKAEASKRIDELRRQTGREA